MATLWSKGAKASDIVEDFTVGNDRILDMELAKYDVIGSKAHIRMLESIGLLTAGELDILTKALDEILGEIEAGKFVSGMWERKSIRDARAMTRSSWTSNFSSVTRS